MDLNVEFNLIALVVIAVVIFIGYKLVSGDSDD